LPPSNINPTIQHSTIPTLPGGTRFVASAAASATTERGPPGAQAAVGSPMEGRALSRPQVRRPRRSVALQVRKQRWDLQWRDALCRVLCYVGHDGAWPSRCASNGGISSGVPSGFGPCSASPPSSMASINPPPGRRPDLGGLVRQFHASPLLGQAGYAISITDVDIAWHGVCRVGENPLTKDRP